MKPRIAALVALMVCCQAVALTAPSEAKEAALFRVGSRTCVLNGAEQKMDVAPYIKHGRVYVPLGFVAAAAGIGGPNVVWDCAKRTVTLTGENRTVKLAVGSKKAVVNGATVPMDVAPEITNRRIMLPLRWAIELLDLQVVWDGPKQTAVVSKKVRAVPALDYPASVDAVYRDYEWEYGSYAYSWHVAVPADLLKWSRDTAGTVRAFYEADGETQAAMLSALGEDVKILVCSVSSENLGDYSPWVKEKANYGYAGGLAARLSAAARGQGYSRFRTAEFVLSFVATAIPYEPREDPQLPAQTLIDDGDCDCKSVLLAAILKNMGYRVALLKFPFVSEEAKDHMAVGIAFDERELPKDRKAVYFYKDGVKYYVAEAAGPGFRPLGETAPETLQRQAYTFPVD
jgi:hypothetical protein